MPTYAYRCKDCQHEYEAFQAIKAEPHKNCPVCKGAVVRLIGAGAGIVFKGSGFYVTDYSKGNKEKKPEGKKSEKGEVKEPKSSNLKEAASAKRDSLNPSKAKGTSGSSS